MRRLWVTRAKQRIFTSGTSTPSFRMSTEVRIGTSPSGRQAAELVALGQPVVHGQCTAPAGIAPQDIGHALSVLYRPAKYQGTWAWNGSPYGGQFIADGLVTLGEEEPGVQLPETVRMLAGRPDYLPIDVVGIETVIDL